MPRPLAGADIAGTVPGLRPPLLLRPDESPFIPVPVMSAFRDLVPGARLHTIGHSKHGPPFPRAAVCSGVFANFLAEQTLSVLTAPAGDTR